MQNITVIPPLNLQRPNTLVVAYGKQNDTKSRWYQAQLLSGDTPWLMPANTTGTIRFAKPDGHGGWYDSLENGTPAVSMSGSTVTMGLVTQVLTCPGDVKIDLMFADTSGSVLTAFSWTLRVEKNAIEDSLIEDSDDYFTILAGQVAQVQAAAAVVREVSEQGDSSIYVSNLANQYGEAIPVGSDLDSYKTPGAYYFGGGTITNSPISTSFRLEVVQPTSAAASSVCIQFCYAATTDRMYMRRWVNSAWSNWARILTDALDPSDSGWVSLTISSSFEAYSSSNDAPIYRKVGNVVQLWGIVKPTATIPGSSDQVVICNLPTGARPYKTFQTVCQGSGTCVWLMTINTNGNVAFSRYRDGGSSGFQDAATTSWLPFSATFLAG